jgi:hypothetical protein
MGIDSFISHEVRVRRKARERNVVIIFEKFMEERLYVGVRKVNRIIREWVDEGSLSVVISRLYSSNCGATGRVRILAV